MPHPRARHSGYASKTKAWADGEGNARTVGWARLSCVRGSGNPCPISSARVAATRYPRPGTGHELAGIQGGAGKTRVLPDSIFRLRLNPVEPPRYATRMPGGVGGPAP
jgi:hypothetical protein